jgi:HK97 family phage prohead protease
MGVNALFMQKGNLMKNKAFNFPQTTGMQIRVWNLDELRVEQRAEKPPVIIGHAALFNNMTVIGSSFYEVIEPGAFSKTIKEGDARCLWNHDMNFVLGRVKSGTLRLSEDDKGLLIENDPPQTALINDMVLEPIRRKDVDQMSFSFDSVRTEWTEQENDLPIRRLLEVKLYDVAPVTFPAYPDTDVAVRNALTAAGIDYAVLTQVITRSKLGGITDEDRALVRSVIDKLTQLFPTSAPTESHPDGNDAERDAQVRMASIRRRLELAEIEN